MAQEGERERVMSLCRVCGRTTRRTTPTLSAPVLSGVAAAQAALRAMHTLQGAACGASAAQRVARGTPRCVALARPAACRADSPAAATLCSRAPPVPALRGRARGARGRRALLCRVPAAVAPWHPESPEPLDADQPTPGFASIPEALAAVAAGQFVVVMDDEDRENEGDLICAADTMTTEAMAFMVRHTSGVVCVALEDARADALGLPLMVQDKVSSGSGGRPPRVAARLTDAAGSPRRVLRRRTTWRSCAPRFASPAT